MAAGGLVGVEGRNFIVTKEGGILETILYGVTDVVRAAQSKVKSAVGILRRLVNVTFKPRYVIFAI